MSLTVRPCGITAARAGVARLHRHLPRVLGGLVAFEALDDGWPVGWAIVGRPVAPVLQARGWVEVTRVAHDGTRNAGSLLYGAAARWARREGSPVLTYTLPTESGASLRGAGWVVVGYTDPVRSPTRAGRPGRHREPGPLDGIRKTKWAPPWALDLADPGRLPRGFAS